LLISYQNISAQTCANCGINKEGPTSALHVHSCGTTSSTSAFNVEDSNSTSLLFVRDDGNVGIGTTSPDEELHVKGDGRILKMESTSAVGNNYIQFYGSAGSKGFIGFGGSSNDIFSIKSDENEEMRFYTNGSEKMRIEADGKIGIGVINPAKKLEVSGAGTNIRINSTNYSGVTPGLELSYSGNVKSQFKWSGTNFDLHVGTVVNNNLKLLTNNNVRLTIEGGGHVGIGTQNPSRLLELEGASIWQKFDETTGTAQAYLIGVDGGRKGLEIYDETAGKTRFIVKKDGNIGINEATPNTVLEVRTGIDKYASIGDWLGVGNFSGLHFGYMDNNSHNNYRKSAIVFERTDASHARGSIHLLNNNYGGSQEASLSDARLTILSSGNVGINTTSPNYKLEVNGTTRFSGLIKTGNDNPEKPNGGSWSGASDKRLKKDIKKFEDGLDVINQINTVRFKYNGICDLPTEKTYIGVVAQDIEKIAPHCVFKTKERIKKEHINTFGGDVQEIVDTIYTDSTETEYVLEKHHEAEILKYNQDGLFYTMINAIQELSAQNEALREELDEINKKLKTK
jgi:hypothetical protein